MRTFPSDFVPSLVPAHNRYCLTESEEEPIIESSESESINARTFCAATALVLVAEQILQLKQNYLQSTSMRAFPSNVRQSRWNADHEAVNSNLAWYLSVYLSSAEFLVYAAVVVFASFVVVGTALAAAGVPSAAAAAAAPGVPSAAAAALFFFQFR